MDVYKEDFINKKLERISRWETNYSCCFRICTWGCCELAMMYDFMVASENAKFVKLGPNLGVSQVQEELKCLQDLLVNQNLWICV